MKKNRIIRLWTLSLVLLIILTTSTQYQEVNAKGVMKRTVTLRAGQKKKIPIKIAKIKKIKSNKASVATVKAVGKKAIRITAKEAGKAVITVKVTTKTKKVKTIRYTEKSYVLREFKYNRNNENGSIYLLADVGVYLERKYIDC